MYNTVKMLIESTVIPQQDFILKNRENFSLLREATDVEKTATNFTINKVPVTRYNNKYVIEFTDGVERVMEQYNYDLSTAVKEIARINEIDVKDCVLIVDESAISRVDLSDLNCQEFDVARR